MGSPVTVLATYRPTKGRSPVLHASEAVPRIPAGRTAVQRDSSVALRSASVPAGAEPHQLRLLDRGRTQGARAAARERAGDRQLLVVLDSLQKLPMGLEDRRAGVDAWMRLLERLRHEHEAAVLLISEIKRDQKGQYTAHEAAFKESGGIEYAADLAITLTRPTANESAEACSTLRVELARDCDDDPRGELAAYRPRFPFYGLEEIEPEKRQPKIRIRAVPHTGGRAEPLSFMDPKRP